MLQRENLVLRQLRILVEQRPFGVEPLLCFGLFSFGDSNLCTDGFRSRSAGNGADGNKMRWVERA